jgi:Domain of unknown function (DUF4190)
VTSNPPGQPGNPEPYRPYDDPPISPAPVPPPYQPPTSDPANSPFAPNYGQPYGQYAPPVAPPPPGTNGFAIASFVLSFCGGLLSVIFGIIALVQIRKSGQKGKGLAIAGLCISGVWVLLIGVGVIFAILEEPKRDASGTITTEGKISVNDLKTGDCIKTLK